MREKTQLPPNPTVKDLMRLLKVLDPRAKVLVNNSARPFVTIGFDGTVNIQSPAGDEQ